MRTQDIVIGTHYRFKDHPHYSYALALEILKPLQGENTCKYAVVKCEHTIGKGDKFGFIRYFRAQDLIKEVTANAPTG